MSLDLDSVTEILGRMMSQIEASALTNDIELPARRYTTTGGAVYDCEQVTVSANSMTTGLAGSTQDLNSQALGGCPPGWTVVVEMAIVRRACEAPGGRRGNEPPPVDGIQRDTTISSQDAAILTDAVEAIAGPGWEQYGTVPASLQFGEVSGGLMAVVLTVTLNMWKIYDLPAVP